MWVVGLACYGEGKWRRAACAEKKSLLYAEVPKQWPGTGNLGTGTPDLASTHTSEGSSHLITFNLRCCCTPSSKISAGSHVECRRMPA